MEKFKYVSSLKDYSSLGSYISHIRKITNEEELFTSLYENLKLPKYFGFNWNAVYDCLRDFSWIKERNIILIHDYHLNIPNNIMSIYLDILLDVINTWENNNEHSFEVIFPLSEKSLLTEILNKEY